jgi:hypothetical protein
MQKRAGFGAALATTLLLLGACASDQTTRNDAGEIVEGGELGVFVASTGDCLNVPDGTEVSAFEGVACTEPHDAQVFAQFDLDGAVYPGAEMANTLGEEGCLERFEGFIGVDYASSKYYMRIFSPSQQSWDAVDDREILCMVVPQSGDPMLTTDLRGVAE